MASVTLKNIYKKYPGGVVAVSDFNLEIADKVRIEITKNGVAAALPKEGEVTAEKKDK